MMLSSKEQLRMVGELLYGARWQTDLSRDLGVSPRLIRQWMSGDRPIQNSALEALPGLLKDRMKKMEDCLISLSECEKGG